jgi:hypothetical protein
MTKKQRQKLLEQEHDIMIDRGECKNDCEDICYHAFQRKTPQQWDKLFKELKI